MKKTITKMAVIGAGTMGTAIAACGARAGLDVVLLEPAPGKDATGASRSSDAIDTIIKKGAMKGTDSERIKSCVFCAGLEDAATLADCDLVIEAVLETLDIKRSTMEFIFKNCGSDTIVGTNTSNISISDIAAEFPEDWQKRFMGIHFFNPVRYMDLVEIIPHKMNSDETIDQIVSLIVDSFGKTAIKCKDRPGFIANRIGSMALTSVMNATEDFGYSYPLADALTGDLLFRPKQGSFRTMDMVGLDICVHTVDYMCSADVPEYERPFRNKPAGLIDIVSAGHLGDKTRAGFYKKEKSPSGTKKYVWDSKRSDYVPFERAEVESLSGIKGSLNRLKAMLYTDLPESKFVRRVLIEPLWLSMMVCDEISHGFADVDAAMRGGYNWAKGPFEICDAVGASEFLELMEKEGFQPPAWVKAKIARDGKFYSGENLSSSPYLMVNSAGFKTILENSDAILQDIGDGIACFSLKTKANTCSIDGAALLLDSAKEIESSRCFKAMVIANPGPNFGAGANLNQVSQAIAAGQYDLLERSVKSFQDANMAIKYMKKPVVCAAQGQALGGSAEIMLHCDRVVASQELYAGLVEMGVGLVPSGGGCAELLFRATSGLKYGQMPAIVSRLDEILLPVAQAKFSLSGEGAFHSGYLRRGDVLVPKQPSVFQKAKIMAASLADCGYIAPIKGTVTAAGENGYTHLMATANAMLSGRMMTPYDALIVEKLARIFTGGDALAGEKITEEDILYLERKYFMELCHTEKTIERINGFLSSGKPVRN